MRLELMFVAGKLQSLLSGLRTHKQIELAQASKAAVSIASKAKGLFGLASRYQHFGSRFWSPSVYACGASQVCQKHTVHLLPVLISTLVETGQ
jgi:hypothetical protein